MTIDKVIFAVDDNPDYQGFWEINSEICEKKLGITPILFRITDHDSDFQKDKFGYVKNVKSLDGVDTGFQAQIYRMYATKYFLDEVCMTNDIDMILFNKEYINNNLDGVSEEDLVIFNSDAYDEKRPECYGIYSGPDRFPICYIVGKGSSFDKIINNNVSFEEYCNRLIDLNLGWDTDEIYFGRCVNNQNEVNIKKIKRNYNSYFHCPNRIEKPDFHKKGIFYLDLEQKINLDSFIDCHCARPYTKFKKQIDNIKNIILNEVKEIYLIGCHVENETQETYLRELTNELVSNNKQFVLTSHTPIPQDIIEKSYAYVYDSVNPKFNTWELDGYATFRFETDSFKIISPYISYGAAKYYHVGVIRLFINALRYLQNSDFDIIHWIEYDSILDLTLSSKSNELLTDFDFVFYGVGSKFSFKLDKVNDDFLKMNNTQIIQELRENDFLAEKLLKNKLIDGSIKNFVLNENDTNTWGRYSQNFNTVKINWSLFENGDTINLFLNNITNEPQFLNLSINNNSSVVELPPHVWSIRNLTNLNQIKYFKISIGDQILVDTDLSIVENYNNIIGKVKFTQK